MQRIHLEIQDLQIVQTLVMQLILLGIQILLEARTLVIQRIPHMVVSLQTVLKTSGIQILL